MNDVVRSVPKSRRGSFVHDIVLLCHALQDDHERNGDRDRLDRKGLILWVPVKSDRDCLLMALVGGLNNRSTLALFV